MAEREPTDAGITKDGIAAVSICNVPGCAHKNVVVIFYDEVELLLLAQLRLPPRWYRTSDGKSFGPGNLHCAYCNQPIHPVFSRAELARDLEVARESGVLAAYHARSAQGASRRVWYGNHKKKPSAPC